MKMKTTISSMIPQQHKFGYGFALQAWIGHKGIDAVKKVLQEHFPIERIHGECAFMVIPSFWGCLPKANITAGFLYENCQVALDTLDPIE